MNPTPKQQQLRITAPSPMAPQGHTDDCPQKRNSRRTSGTRNPRLMYWPQKAAATHKCHCQVMGVNIYIWLYNYICISPYININRTAFVGWLQPGNEWEQYGGPADVILSFSMRLYRYIYTIAIYRPHLQEFTGKTWQFCHVFILPTTTMKRGWRSQHVPTKNICPNN